MAEVETKHCSNCKREIPANNFIMHQSHCARNISLCKQCGETVPHRQMEQHIEEVHTKVNCECGEAVEKQNLDDHKKNECNLRIKMCRYCEMDVTFKDLPSHEDFCGSRTESCPKCSRYICFKDKQLHENTACALPKPPPPVSTMHNKLHDNLTPDEPDFFQAFAAGHRFGGARTFQDEFSSNSFGMFGQPVTPPVHVSHSTEERKHRKNKSRVQNLLGEKRKSDNRKTRTSERRITYPDDMDFLTRHLAHDLSNDVDDTAVSESDIDTMLQEAYNIPDPPMPSSTYSDFAQQDSSNQDDSTKIPCEFCSKLVPMHDLILHQSGCQYDQQKESRRNLGGLVSRGPPQLRIPSPPVSSNIAPLDDSEDIPMLPCEFCSELLPAESIPFHQPMCSMNKTTTPLPTDNNNHPLDSMLRTANVRPKLVTKKNPLNLNDDVMPTRTRNNHVSSASYQQESSLLPSPVDKYSSPTSNFSSVPVPQIPPSHFYGNANRRKKHSSSQSSSRAQETLQAFLDEDPKDPSYTVKSEPEIFGNLEEENFLELTNKKASNIQPIQGVPKNSRQGRRDPHSSSVSSLGQQQHFKQKNRSGAPAIRVPVNRRETQANWNGVPANRNGFSRNETPANYNKRDQKVDKKPSRSRKKSSDLYSNYGNFTNSIPQKPSTENHMEQVRMFTEREKAQRQKTVNTAANGTKPKRTNDNQQVEVEMQPIYKSHDQRARNPRTRSNHYVSSRQISENEELQPTFRTGRTQNSNLTHSRQQVKKPPGSGQGSNYY